MRELKTNTAVLVTVGPFYDKTDGVTIETSLTITNERITLTADTDAGSAPTNILDNIAGATSGTSNDLNYITGNDAGLMQLELSAADVNRLGRMTLTITDAANHCPVFHEFEVVSAAYWDWKYGSTIPAVNATQVNGTAQTARDLGASVLLSNGTGTGQVSLSSGAVLLQPTQTGVTIPTVTTLTNLPAITANWLTAAGMDATAGAEIADAVWDEAMGGHTGGGSAGLYFSLVLADTDELQAEWANGGRLDLILDSAASAGDPWITAIPGAYSAGSAGHILGNRLVGTIATGTHNPQSGDTYARLGAPAGASVSADIAAIEAQTDDIGVAGAGLTALASAADLSTVAGYLDTEIAAIKAKTDNLPAAPAAVGDLSGLATAANLATVDTVVDGIATTLGVAGAGLTDLSVNVAKINNVTIIGDGSGTPFDVA